MRKYFRPIGIVLCGTLMAVGCKSIAGEASDTVAVRNLKTLSQPPLLASYAKLDGAVRSSDQLIDKPISLAQFEHLPYLPASECESLWKMGFPQNELADMVMAGTKIPEALRLRSYFRAGFPFPVLRELIETGAKLPEPWTVEAILKAGFPQEDLAQLTLSGRPLPDGRQFSTLVAFGFPVSDMSTLVMSGTALADAYLYEGSKVRVLRAP